MKRENVTVATNNENYGGSKMKGLREMKKKLVLVLCGVGMIMSQITTTCLAADEGTSAITVQPANLKTLIIAVIGVAGVIIIAKNIIDFAQAYLQEDSSTMHSVFKGIVIGIIMAGISTALSFWSF